MCGLVIVSSEAIAASTREAGTHIYRVIAANWYNPSLLQFLLNEDMGTFMKFKNHWAGS
jgi:hypothetical protein